MTLSTSIHSGSQIIQLKNSRGFALTDGRGTILPISHIMQSDNDALLGSKFMPLDGVSHFELKELYGNPIFPIHQFTLDRVNLLIHQNYQLPINIQITLGTSQSTIFWDYIWEDGQEVIFDLTNHFIGDYWNEPIGVLIQLLRVNEVDIIVEYERYFFKIQILEEIK